jgi:hypothetical protein
MIGANTYTRSHFIRDCIEERRVKIISIGTAEQLADIFKKAIAAAMLL